MMKKYLTVVLFLPVLIGCGQHNNELDEKSFKKEEVEITNQKDTTIQSNNPCTNYSGFTFEKLRNKLGVKWDDLKNDKDQNPFLEQMYYHGELYNGAVKQCYDNGGIWSTSIFKDGLLNGKHVHYLENGNVWFEGQYKNGKEDGEWKTFNENGIVTEINIYSNGKLVQTKVFD